MDPTEKDVIATLFGMFRRFTPFLHVRAPARVYSVREASTAVGTIVEAALAGSPQIIQKRGTGRVVVIREEMVTEMLRRAGGPASFAEMFPVTETEPPLTGEPKARPRPGRVAVRL